MDDDLPFQPTDLDDVLLEGVGGVMRPAHVPEPRDDNVGIDVHEAAGADGAQAVHPDDPTAGAGIGRGYQAAHDSRVLLIEDTGGRPLASIYFQDRNVVHALCEDLAGRKAVYRALTLDSGKFRFLRGLVPGVAPSVRDSVPNLLLEGFRRLDRTSHLSALLPEDDVALHMAPEPPQDDIRLTAGEWRILSLVNGKRTIREIVAVSGRAAGWLIGVGDLDRLDVLGSYTIAPLRP